jgi:predicted DNA-binding transcriptional regulator AlpA
MASRQNKIARASHARQSRLNLPKFVEKTVNTRKRLLSKAVVLDRIGLSYVQVWKMMLDGTFPRSVKLGGKSLWFEEEINAFMASLQRSKLKGDTEAAS